eukprot:scaffold44813_cov62-Phaeocystis_antarctica.AAC.2
MPSRNACWRTLPIVSTHPRFVTTFFLVKLAAMFVLDVLHLGGIAQPEAFCAGTTAAYRKGDGSNSALTPSTTLRPPITPAPVESRHMHLARRLRHVPRLRYLQRHELGQRAEGCPGAWCIQRDLDPCEHAVPARATCASSKRSTPPA